MYELVPLDQIDPNPYQSRQAYEPEALEQLARGIKLKRKQLPDTLGLMQVPMARKVNGRFQLAFGHRRFKAFKHNYRTEVSASEWLKMPLQIADLSDEEMYDFMARENGDREDLDDIEKAQSIKRAQEELDWPLAKAANAHGLSKSAASNLTRLLLLPYQVQQMVSAKKVGQRHARSLIRLMQVDPPLVDECLDIANAAAEGKSAVEVEELVDSLILEYKNRKIVTERIEDKTCPRCDAPVKLYDPPGHRFGCGVHSWENVTDFDWDWRQRENREAEERKIEERRQQTCVLYCRRCNARQEFNGQEVHEGGIVTCNTCDGTTSLMYWRKEPMVYKPLNLDDDDPISGDSIVSSVEPACPFWTKIPETAETCYICNKPADYHNNGHLKVPGADFHLCHHHYWEHLSLINGHLAKETLQSTLDKLIEDKKQAGEAEAKEAEAVEYAVYPCHVCGEQKIRIEPDGNFVICDGCGEFWDLISEYHEDRERTEKEVEADGGVPESKKAKMCEHCGKREANVQNVPYCSKCWAEDLTDWLKCPNCNAVNTIAKTRPDDDLIECWSCKEESLKSTWVNDYSIVQPGYEQPLLVKGTSLISKEYGLVTVEFDNTDMSVPVTVDETGEVLTVSRETLVFPENQVAKTVPFKANSDGTFIDHQCEFLDCGGTLKMLQRSEDERGGIICLKCNKWWSCLWDMYNSTNTVGTAEAHVTDDLKLELTLNPLNGDGEPETHLDIGLKQEEVSPELALQRQRIDVNNRFLALVRSASMDQLQEIDAWLDDVEQLVFPENTEEAVVTA